MSQLQGLQHPPFDMISPRMTRVSGDVTVMSSAACRLASLSHLVNNPESECTQS